jgi:hypothetical protein
MSGTLAMRRHASPLAQLLSDGRPAAALVGVETAGQIVYACELRRGDVLTGRARLAGQRHPLARGRVAGVLGHANGYVTITLDDLTSVAYACVDQVELRHRQPAPLG